MQLKKDNAKRTKMKLINWLFFCITAFFFTSCTAVTPHENFKISLRTMIGVNMDSLNMKGSQLISTKILPNNNIEYRYRRIHRRNDPIGCIHIFEVDPASRVIVRTDFEGSEYSCSMRP